MEVYRALPDSNTTPLSETDIESLGNKEELSIRNKMQGKMPIRDEDLALIRHYQQTTGVIPSLIFEKADDVPDRLTPYIISNWLSGHTTSAEPAHVEWVLKRAKAVLEKALSGA